MKTINETFTDEEYEALLKRKLETNLTWHDFIMLLDVKPIKGYTG